MEGHPNHIPIFPVFCMYVCSSEATAFQAGIVAWGLPLALFCLYIALLQSKAENYHGSAIYLSICLFLIYQTYFIQQLIHFQTPLSQ